MLATLILSAVIAQSPQTIRGPEILDAEITVVDAMVSLTTLQQRISGVIFFIEVIKTPSGTYVRSTPIKTAKAVQKPAAVIPKGNSLPREQPADEPPGAPDVKPNLSPPKAQEVSQRVNFKKVR